MRNPNFTRSLKGLETHQFSIEFVTVCLIRIHYLILFEVYYIMPWPYTLKNKRGADPPKKELDQVPFKFKLEIDVIKWIFMASKPQSAPYFIPVHRFQLYYLINLCISVYFSPLPPPKKRKLLFYIVLLATMLCVDGFKSLLLPCTDM